MATAPLPEHRPVCMRCRRPRSVCYCAHLPYIETQTRIVILQHPRERDRAIGTAHMASLCLANSDLYVGVDFEDSRELEQALASSGGNVALLYPDAEAQSVEEFASTGPLTLVVVDGTWWQARKMVRRNAKLAALPRIAFTPDSPSEYRIRKEPSEHCVSTIEALMIVLGKLEGDPGRFESMLKPFRAMVDAQIECRDRLHGARSRKRARAREPRSPIPACIRERPSDLLCVIGEANAWPYCSKERGSDYPDELVHWVACRPATGEQFDYVVAPRNPLAANTTKHIRLSAKELAAGGSLPELFAAFDAFVRPTDVLCCWGHYATSLFVESGGVLPNERVDLRPLTHVVEKRRFGALEDFPRDAGPKTATVLRGRAGSRLDVLAQVVRDYGSR